MFFFPVVFILFFFFQAEDGIRDLVRSRGLGDVYKRQLSIRGIRFAALFIEKETHIKLSFRSKGNFPVNEFASEFFSGGGHLNASGGEYNDTLENTIEYFLKVLKANFTRFNKN